MHLHLYSRPTVLLVLCTLFVGWLPHVANAESLNDLQLTRDGRPNAIIVVPGHRQWDKESGLIQVERHTSKCLQATIMQMSGARLPILHDTKLGEITVTDGRVTVTDTAANAMGNFILIGETKVTAALGMDTSNLKAGGYHVKTFDNALVLLGSTDISHPVSDGGGQRAAIVQVLESLGCRYLWPGELGKVIPSLPTIAIPQTDVTVNPALSERKIRWDVISDRAGEGINQLDLSVKRWRETLAQQVRDTKAHQLVDPPTYYESADFSWTNWHGTGGDSGLFGGHTFGDAWERWGEAHPDWFALQAGGSRDQSNTGQRERLCVSNNQLIAAIADDILKQVRQHPEQRVFSLCTNDGGYSGFCLCENCEALDFPDGPKVTMLLFKEAGKADRTSREYVSLTDRYVWFWNQIAQRVTQEHPDALFVIEAYSLFSAGPRREKLHPNMILRYVPSDIDEWEYWKKAGAKRMYWRPNILHRGKQEAELTIYANQMASNVNQLRKDGMFAVDVDTVTGSWSTLGFNYYTICRLAWNPNLQYEDMLDDYALHGFGPAAEPIKQYYTHAEFCRDNFAPKEIPLEEIAKLRDLLAEATNLAKDDETIRKRVAFLRMGLNYTEVRRRIEELVSLAKANQPYDKTRAALLFDLHYLMLRDFALHHPIAIDAGMVMRYGVNFRAWHPLGLQGRKPNEKLITEAAALPRQTGEENSADELVTAFGLDGSNLPMPQRSLDESIEMIMEADEVGDIRELPSP